MADYKDSDDNKGKNLGLTAQDVALWKAMTCDVARFEGRDYQEGMDIPPEAVLRAPAEGKRGAVSSAVMRADKAGSSSRAAAQGHEMDRRSEERFRKGQMSIEGRIDLHGMNQGEARQALRVFILDGYARSLRCVLVITGKGERPRASARQEAYQMSGGSNQGVLKRNVPVWLREEGLEGIVLKTAFAQPQHGGAGALYVLLRRRR